MKKGVCQSEEGGYVRVKKGSMSSRMKKEGISGRMKKKGMSDRMQKEGMSECRRGYVMHNEKGG